MSKKRREKNLLARMKARGLHQQKKFLSHPDMPTFADIEAPEGFRPIPMSQALMEFVTPLTERLASDDLDDVNALMQIAIGVWNLALPQGLPIASREELVENIAAQLDLDECDAEQLFDELIERKQYLFPEEIQPKDPRMLFMRNTEIYRIVQFDEAQLRLSDESLPADADDLTMLDALCELDACLERGDVYADWERLYLDVERACCDRYCDWLTAKGAPEKQRQEFPLCVETFLNFVYQYSGSSVLQVSDFDFEAFFLDHLPRKVIIQPDDYVFWPPAMRLFYRFLAEKGYGDDVERFTALISAIEPDFLTMLRKQL